MGLRFTEEEYQDMLRRNPHLRPDLQNTARIITPDAPSINEEPRRGGGKYHVSPKEDRTYNGVVYASKKEMKKAEELDLEIKAGEITFYLRQVPFTLPGGDKYVADFMVFKTTPQGQWWMKVIEVKGVWTALAKNKFKRFKKGYPELEIVVE